MSLKKRPRGRGLPFVVAGASFGLAAGLGLGTLVLAPIISGESLQIPGIETGGSKNSGGRESSPEAVAATEKADKQLAASDSVVSSLAEKGVAGTLKNRPVMVLVAPHAEDADVSAVKTLLKQSGAIDAGSVTLKEKFFASEGSDELKSLVANVLPAGAKLDETKLDSGTHSGQALGAALLMDPNSAQPIAEPEERGNLLSALQQQEFIAYEKGTILPAQAVVIISGVNSDQPGNEVAAKNEASFAAALDGIGTATVVSGRLPSAEPGGVIDKLRADHPDAVSTVDAVDKAFGRVATILAIREQLEGRSGAYGVGPDAAGVAPDLQ